MRDAQEGKRPRLGLLAAAVMALGLLAGCPLLETFLADEIQEAEQKLEDVKGQVQAAPGKLVEAATEEGEEEEDADAYKRPELLARRDPFVFEPPVVASEKGDEERVLEPLESYDISQLRLVGLVTNTAVPKAMFKDATSFGHIAKEGDRIGRDGGRITQIRANEVEVTIAKQTAAPLEPGVDPPPNQKDSEPVTIIIRLSDTELEAPEETTEEEQELLQKIKTGGGEAPAPPSPPSPPSPPGDGAP
jgi:Tfp pilus assembly protein PilP